MVAIESGVLKNSSSNDIAYEILSSIDPVLSLKADQAWCCYFLKIIEQLAQNHPGENVRKLIAQNSINDQHWRWFNKVLALSDPNKYEWFYLIADGEVQAAAVVCHPEVSRFNSDEIIYIDYVAVAPWNRDTVIAGKRFGGLGSKLIKALNLHLGKKLSYREGFSLHSLAQAKTYYERIGMTDFGPDSKKQDMHYFEMEASVAKGYIYV